MLTFEKKVKRVIEEDVAPCAVPGCGGQMNKVMIAYKATVLFALPLGTYGERDAMCCSTCQNIVLPDEDGQYPGMTISTVPQK